MKENLIKIPTKHLSESGWQELRQSFVVKGMSGGSDAGTLIGWNKWKSPVTMFYQAIGITKFENIMNIEMLMGKMQEDNIANQWRYYDEDEKVFVYNVTNNIKPRDYKQEKFIFINPDYPTLFANVDGIVTKHPVKGKKRGVLEIKKINGSAIDSYVDGRPPQYIAQAQQYMMVLDLDYAELCMRVDGRKLVVHMIERDEEIQKAILKQSQDHQTRVLNAIEALKSSNGDIEDMYSIAAQLEPPADGSEDFNAFISLKHKERNNEKTVAGDKNHDKWIDQYLKANERVKEAEAQKLLWGNKLKQAMEKKGASVLDTDIAKITWRKSFLVKKKF